MVPRLVATSATIIPCGGNAATKPLSIPVKSNPSSEEGMSLIVQLGTTNVGYTPTLTTAVVNSNSGSRAVNFRSVGGQQQTSVAKHRLPMQINRQSQQVPRTLLTQPHATLPTRNITTLTRPVPPPAPQQSIPSPTVAGRVLASPVKDSTLDDDLLEGVVEKRPKYHKHLPLNYQYVLQDHNYGAPPPPNTHSPPKPMVNGLPTANGLTRSQPPANHSLQTTNYTPNNFPSRANKNIQPPASPASFSSTPMSNVFGIGMRGLTPAEESDVESTDGEREVDPQGEETETAPEGEDNEDDSVTRCICDFQHDDGYMICCDKCSVWQHVDCMGIDRSNIPDEYLCEKCQPRRIDKQKAIALQLRKKKELIDTSDSSSDTSSSSGANVPLRKPNNAVNNRRRSEPGQRKNSGTNNKQRRELVKEGGANRQNNRLPMKKKQAEKKPPVRRKSSQGQAAVSPAGEKSTVVEKKATTPISGVDQLRQWIDSYEEAVTNHYSPELRARIASIKVNGIHSDLKLPTNLMSTPKCRVSLLPSGIKILMASVALSGNQPLLELRGKYMLCGSGPTNRPPRPAVPPPGPHIFHYKLPRDPTEVCVDARTYGNDARFVRRCCKPNAEMRHCIEKGALHLYLVTTKAIDKNTEILLAVGPGLSCVNCGESCPASAPVSPLENHKTLNGQISPNNNNISAADKRRRGRRRTLSENLSPPKASVKPVSKNLPKTQAQSKISPAPSKISPTPNKVLAPSKVSSALSKISPTPKPTSKVVPSVRVPTPPPRVPTPPPEPVIEREPTPPPIIPARPPTPPTPPPPAPTTRSAASNAARKSPSTPKKDSTSSEVVLSSRQLKKEAADKKNKMTREERKMEAIMKAFERMEKDQARKQEAQARQTQRKDSSETDSKPELRDKDMLKDSDKDEPMSPSKVPQRKRKFSVSKRKGRGRSQSTPQPILRPRRTLRRSQPTRDRSDSEDSSDESPVRVNTTASNLASSLTSPKKQESAANSLMDFSKQSYESPPHGQVNTSSSSGETPPTPMSKTAMLVAAAVGPLAPGFKFPKTKKGLINSWLKSPEGSPPALPEETPPTRGFGATKKRWLRQAISEECDSPTSRPDVTNSPTEHSAPPKKRRLARESISEDQSFTPPTTPTHTAEALSQCGSSQESEGPDSPAADLVQDKTKDVVKTEPMEGEELEEYVKGNVKDELCEVKNETKPKRKSVTIKEESDLGELKEEKQGGHIEDKPGAAAASATKRKLSISEYRQRKQQGPGVVEAGDGGKRGAEQPTSPHTPPSSPGSSSSEDENDATVEAQPAAVIAKSLMLEAAIDTNLNKKPSTHLFDSAPTLVERQRENLTQRLKREFGLFLSDDEEQEKARKQANVDSLNKEKKKEVVEPPPPPAEPHHYPLFFPGVGHPMYTNRYPPAPPAAVEPPPAAPIPYPTSYYNHLPH